MDGRRRGDPAAVASDLRSELGRRRSEARRAERRVERDLSRAVHDLKAPLSAVKGYVDMMLRGIAGPMPPTANRYLERIRDVVDRQRQIIDDRLRPRRDSGSPPLVDVARALAAAADRAGRGLRARRIQLALELPPRGCWVAARPSLVELMTRRLLRHLVAVAPRGSTAHLVLHDDFGRRRVELSISGGEPPWLPAAAGRSHDLQIALAAAERLGAQPTSLEVGGLALRIDLPHDA